MTEAAFLEAVAVSRCALGPRLVYADWLDERGRVALAAAIRRQAVSLLPKFAAVGAAGAAVGAAVAAAVGVAADAGAAAVGVGGGGAGGGAGSADAAAGVADLKLETFDLLGGGLAMCDGLQILVLPFGYYYACVMVAWVRCEDGLEVKAHNARVVRFNQGAVDVEELAAKGPRNKVQLRQAVAVESLWRPNVLRALPADEKAWAEHCPRPKGFAD